MSNNPNIATTMEEMVTPRQLVAIRAISHSQKVDAEDACKDVFGCKPEELTRKAASELISFLKDDEMVGIRKRHQFPPRPGRGESGEVRGKCR